MNAPANLPKILLIDSNVYFAKRLGDALKQQGFDVVPSTCLLYTSPSPRDSTSSRMPSSA